MARPLLVPVACVAALAACATSREAGVGAPPAPKAAVAAAPTPAPDRSLTSAEYVAAGFPAPDRTWQPRDYVAAHEALAKLVSARDATALPRYGSARSGEAFARLADRRNFDGDDWGPVVLRAAMLVEGVEGLSQVVGLYLKGLFAVGPMTPEILDLTCLTLHSGRRMADLFAEVPPPNAEAPNRARYDEGKRKVQSGLAKAVNGSLGPLSDRSGDLQARARYAACLVDEIPPALPHLTAIMRAEIRQKIGRAVTGEPKGTPTASQLERLALAASAVP